MTSTFWSSRAGRVANVVLVILAMLAVWEGVVRLFGIKAFLLPPVSDVLVELWRNPGWYVGHTLHTLLETALGFAGAVVLGIVMAIGIVSSRFVEQTLYTVLVTLNAIPKVALAPLFVLWLGTGIEPKIAVALMIALFPIVIDTVLGLKSTDPDMLDLARSFRASRRQMLWKIRFPHALPSVFAGLKVGISFAFIGAIVGEFVASQSGLGYVIISSQASFDTSRVFAAIILLAVAGTLLFYLVEMAEHACVPWHVSRRRSTAAVPTGRPAAAH
ncbi:ABC transporter permease [Acuticoccus mangrovi]|uniref:ABC transporter permease n=1 Tax=Acuticoccus mangrovi TaxID=2796142 RepID=A0A934MIC5_9HYPH|nr:ABC transporter permease [Acuticoccus mangrovi]MBJ3778618.1 ABC transporter permease [Acuticoccus mangrovi]